MRRLGETTGLGLVRRTSSVIAATGGAVAIGRSPGSRRPGTPRSGGRFRREHPGSTLDGWPLPAD